MDAAAQARCVDAVSSLLSRAVARPFEQKLIDIRTAVPTYASVPDFRAAVDDALTVDSDDELAPLAQELKTCFLTQTRSFTGDIVKDWLGELTLLCEEFGEEARSAWRDNASFRRSSSLLAMTPTPSDREDDTFTWDQMKRLASDIAALEDIEDRERLFECLKEMEPRALGTNSYTTVDLTKLSQSTLGALRDELESIKAR